ncbi:MAG: UvrD-helicase domain-containing protein, partial [Sphaerochaeta sp.]|nr:UvrD-helicase domain-containing protein [Sphaerochaeta sp.]
MAELQELMDQLNEAQKEAVLENSHPLLVLAGAGSGKTRVITTKIAYAIEQLGIPPYKILAVTFTNKAANEMKQRVGEMLEGRSDVNDCNIRTFHSFGAWFLRRFGSEIGLDANFTIYDDDDSLSLLASCFPNYKKRELDPIMRKISYAKDRGLTYTDNLQSLKVDSTFKRMFEAYERKLHQVGNVDFADLIGRSIELLETKPEIQQWVHRRFSMILVDEYQDSNAAQFKLLHRLVGPGTFICVVGDDDQSIYRFRGAEVQNILSFPDQYPMARTVKLEQNYRSTQNILEIANSVIKNNKGRHEKQLWTANRKGG